MHLTWKGFLNALQIGLYVGRHLGDTKKTENAMRQ
jgi:hypothetical protein